MNLQTGENCVVKPGKNKIVIGFQITREKSLFCDFFIVSSLGVDFCKIITEKPVKVNIVKSYNISVSDFWFSSIDGILVVNTLKTLEFTPFFLYQTKGVKYFQGPSFTLTQKYLENGFSPSFQSQDLSELSITPLDKIQLLVTKVYDNSYLLNLDGLLGILYLYKIDQDQQSQLALTIQLKPGGYALRVVDNLIIVHNYGPQESYIFDILKDPEPAKCFVQVKHRGFLNPEYLFPQVQHHSEIDPHFVVISKEFYLDVLDGRLFELKLHTLALIQNYPNSLDSILFLLRRNRCLTEALALIKKCLEEKMEVNQLIEFFNVTNYAYKETAMLRKVQRREDPRESVQKAEGNEGKKPEVQLKSKSGMSILLQSDMYISVFKPYYKDAKEYSYLCTVLIAYIYSLVSQDLHVHVSHQYLLVKTLLKLQNFRMIQYLIQYQLLANHLDVALLLVTLEGNQEKYPDLFNFGVDMLYRLKQYSVIVKILLEKQDYFEALNVITTYEDSYDLDHLKNHTVNTEYCQIVLETLEEYGIKAKPL